MSTPVKNGQQNVIRDRLEEIKGVMSTWRFGIKRWHTRWKRGFRLSA